MSLILDALRKMEEERKARCGGAVDIRPAVLGRRGRPAAPARSLLLPAAAGLVLLAAGIGVGLFLKGTPPAHDPQPAGLSAQAVVPENQPVTGQPAPPPVVPVRVEPAVPTLPATGAPALPLARSASEAPPAAVSVPADTVLTISGIAWQEERGLRRAVVNGALVGEGAEIAGARVLEIRERSVRFARGGRSFEVSYSSAFPLN